MTFGSEQDYKIDIFLKYEFSENLIIYLTYSSFLHMITKVLVNLKKKILLITEIKKDQ